MPAHLHPEYVGLQGRGAIEEIDLRPGASRSGSSSPAPASGKAKTYDDEWLPPNIASSGAATNRKASSKSGGGKRK